MIRSGCSLPCSASSRRRRSASSSPVARTSSSQRMNSSHCCCMAGSSECAIGSAAGRSTERRRPMVTGRAAARSGSWPAAPSTRFTASRCVCRSASGSARPLATNCSGRLHRHDQAREVGVLPTTRSRRSWSAPPTTVCRSSEASARAAVSASISAGATRSSTGSVPSAAEPSGVSGSTAYGWSSTSSVGNGPCGIRYAASQYPSCWDAHWSVGPHRSCAAWPHSAGHTACTSEFCVARWPASPPTRRGRPSSRPVRARARSWLADGPTVAGGGWSRARRSWAVGRAWPPDPAVTLVGVPGRSRAASPESAWAVNRSVAEVVPTPTTRSRVMSAGSTPFLVRSTETARPARRRIAQLAQNVCGRSSSGTSVSGGVTGRSACLGRSRLSRTSSSFASAHSSSRRGRPRSVAGARTTSSWDGAPSVTCQPSASRTRCVRTSQSARPPPTSPASDSNAAAPSSVSNCPSHRSAAARSRPSSSASTDGSWTSSDASPGMTMTRRIQCPSSGRWSKRVSRRAGRSTPMLPVTGHLRGRRPCPVRGAAPAGACRGWLPPSVRRGPVAPRAGRA